MNLTPFFRANRLFAEFSAQELEVLERLFEIQAIKDGQILVREGERVASLYNALFVLLEGRVQVTCRPPPGGGIGVSRELESGAVFGLVALVDDGPRSATCQALGPVKLAALMRNTFDALCHSHPTIAAKFLYLVARQLAHDVRGASQAICSAVAGDMGTSPVPRPDDGQHVWSL